MGPHGRVVLLARAAVVVAPVVLAGIDDGIAEHERPHETVDVLRGEQYDDASPEQAGHFVLRRLMTKVLAGALDSSDWNA